MEIAPVLPMPGKNSCDTAKDNRNFWQYLKILSYSTIHRGTPAVFCQTLRLCRTLGRKQGYVW
jgi:hypothetical protein